MGPSEDTGHEGQVMSSMSNILRSQLRPLLGTFRYSKCATSSPCKYSTDLPSGGNDLTNTSPQEVSNADRTMQIRRQRPGDRPILRQTEDYLANYEAWRRQLPHEEDPSVLSYSPDPRNKDITGPSNHGWGFSSDWLVNVSRKIDFSQEGLKEYFTHIIYRQDRERQKFNPLRHGVLGPDLAAAHFITFRGGRVKFVGHTEWWLDSDNLPHSYEDGYLIEKVDASSTLLNDEGITNLCNLYNLTDLNLTNNPSLDVYSFDKLYRQFRFSTCLKSLNLTNCINFCENSLAAIHRVPSLEQVIITGTRAAQYKFTQLIVIFLHELNPRLKIII